MAYNRSHDPDALPRYVATQPPAFQTTMTFLLTKLVSGLPNQMKCVHRNPRIKTIRKMASTNRQSRNLVRHLLLSHDRRLSSSNTDHSPRLLSSIARNRHRSSKTTTRSRLPSSSVTTRSRLLRCRRITSMRAPRRTSTRDRPSSTRDHRTNTHDRRPRRTRKPPTCVSPTTTATRRQRTPRANGRRRPQTTEPLRLRYRHRLPRPGPTLAPTQRFCHCSEP